MMKIMIMVIVIIMIIIRCPETSASRADSHMCVLLHIATYEMVHPPRYKNTPTQQTELIVSSNYGVLKAKATQGITGLMKIRAPIKFASLAPRCRL